MQRPTAIIIAVLTIFLAAFTTVAVAARAAFEPISTDPTFCHGADIDSVTVRHDRIIWRSSKWPADDGNPDTKYYEWAPYLNVKTGTDGRFITAPLTVTGIARDNHHCLAYTVKAVTRWHGQNRAVVKTYEAGTNLWGGTSTYRRLPTKCVDCT